MNIGIRADTATISRRSLRRNTRSRTWRPFLFLIGAVPDSIVSHGAGWAQIRKNGHTVNIVSLHTWPQVYGFGLADKLERKASAAAREGDRFRRMEPNMDWKLLRGMALPVKS